MNFTEIILNFKISQNKNVKKKNICRISLHQNFYIAGYNNFCYKYIISL